MLARRNCFTALGAIALVSAWCVDAAAQARIAEAKGLRCTFSRTSTGTWMKDRGPEAAVKAASLVLRYDEIDTDTGIAQLRNGSVGSEVTVRLTPLPERVELLLAAFDDVGRCADAVGRLIASGLLPAGLEMMDAPAIRAADAFAGCAYPLDAEALLLCELDGPGADVEAALVTARQVLSGAGATSVPRRQPVIE